MWLENNGFFIYNSLNRSTKRKRGIIKEELYRKNTGKFGKVEFPEIKVIKIDNSMDGLKSILDIAKERIHDNK